jgi:hypothetical protein
MSVDGTHIAMILPSVTPLPDSNPIMPAVAAESGLAVIACCDAITLIDIGRSGRTPALRETSAITGSTA